MDNMYTMPRTAHGSKYNSQAIRCVQHVILHCTKNVHVYGNSLLRKTQDLKSFVNRMFTWKANFVNFFIILLLYMLPQTLNLFNISKAL